MINAPSDALNSESYPATVWKAIDLTDISFKYLKRGALTPENALCSGRVDNVYRRCVQLSSCGKLGFHEIMQERSSDEHGTIMCPRSRCSSEKHL